MHILPGPLYQTSLPHTDRSEHRVYLVCLGMDSRFGSWDESCADLAHCGQAWVIRPGNQLRVADNLAACWRQSKVHQTLQP